MGRRRNAFSLQQWEFWFPDWGAPLRLRKMRNGKVHPGTRSLYRAEVTCAPSEKADFWRAPQGWGKTRLLSLTVTCNIHCFSVCWKFSDLTLFCRKLTVKIFFLKHLCRSFLPSPGLFEHPRPSPNRASITYLVQLLVIKLSSACLCGPGGPVAGSFQN